MNLAMMIFFGAGVGAGALITWRALVPRPTPIALVLSDLARQGTPIGGTAAVSEPAVDRIGTIARRLVGAVGQDTTTGLRSELELVDRAPERHAFDKLLGGVAGLVVGEQRLGVEVDVLRRPPLDGRRTVARAAGREGRQGDQDDQRQAVSSLPRARHAFPRQSPGPDFRPPGRRFS